MKRAFAEVQQDGTCLLWAGVYQMKYYYPENIVSGCNGVRNT